MGKENNNKVPYTFFPTSTAMCKMFDLETAVVYGRIWSYSCHKSGSCFASKARIAREVGLSTKTVERRIKILLENEYITDITPGLRNHPHALKISNTIIDIDDRWKEINGGEEEVDEELIGLEPETIKEIKEMEIFESKYHFKQK